MSSSCTPKLDIDPVANREIPYQAVVNAVWLTEGNLEKAAKLLRAPVEDLARAIGPSEGASTHAFCGRAPEWMPEDSLRSPIDNWTLLELAKAALMEVTKVLGGACWVGDAYDVRTAMQRRLAEIETETNNPGGIAHILGPTKVENTRPISIRQNGMEAFRAGHGIGTNPWDPFTVEAELWRAGWFTAESDRITESEG